MQKFLLLACVALAAILFVVPGATFAQVSHNVTFLVNTASVPDTITALSPVVLTGGGTKNADAVLTGWGSGLALTNVGGDYWAKTVQFDDSAEIHYKIRIGANGWEENGHTLHAGQGTSEKRRLFSRQCDREFHHIRVRRPPRSLIERYDEWPKLGKFNKRVGADFQLTFAPQ